MLVSSDKDEAISDRDHHIDNDHEMCSIRQRPCHITFSVASQSRICNRYKAFGSSEVNFHSSKILLCVIFCLAMAQIQIPA